MSTTRPSQPALSGFQTIVLSREELLMLLRLLGASTLPGFETSWAYKSETPASRAAVLSEAARASLEPSIRAMMARAYLGAPEVLADDVTRVSVSIPVLAVVGACMRSAFSLRLTSTFEHSLAQFYLHEWDGLGVLHATITDGIHSFMPLDGKRGIVEAVLSLLHLDEASPRATSQESIALPKQTFEEAMQRVLQGINEAAILSQLTQASPSSPTALHALARAMAAQQQISEISIATRRQDGTTELHTVICLTGSNTFWCLQLGQQTNMLHSLDPSGEQGLRKWLTGHLSA